MSNPIDPDSMNCAHCRFWVSMKGRRVGECRRFPPQVIREGECDAPVTYGDYWCGEFKRGKGKPRPDDPQSDTSSSCP
jgi:high potential iron-sulfur protein